MNRIGQILDCFKALEVDDEDGTPLRISLESPLAKEELAKHEESVGAELPDQFRQLLLQTNGMKLFGLAIMPIDQQVLFHHEGIIAFHNWGNGDFDCVATSTSDYPMGAVVFMNHSAAATVLICESLATWLEEVVREIREKGTLLHPSDYQHRDEQGLYRRALDGLNGVACELNS